MKRIIRHLFVDLVGDNMVTVKKCPNCGSTNIKWVVPQLGQLYECFNCGYRGALIIEEEIEK